MTSLNNEKKNVLLIVPTLRLGGQERVAAKTTDILRDACNVTVAVFDSTEAAYTPEGEIVDLCCPAANGVLRKVWNVFRRVLALKKLKIERKTDVSYSFGSTANLANVLSKTRGKTVVRFSGYGEMKDNLLCKLICRLSDNIVCCSRKLQLDMSQMFPQFHKKILCLQNPYDEKGLQFSGAEAVDDFNFGPKVVVTHGRLEEVKNYPRLIKAFSLVRRESPDAQLLFIGEGGMRSRLQELIAQYDLLDCVTLLGFRENPFAYLSKSTVYVLTSYAEGFPNGLVESMHFLPVISVDCKSGPREILSEGDLNQVCEKTEEADYGILVPPAAKRELNPNLLEEDKILAEAILSMLNNPKKRQKMQERAQGRAKQFGHNSYRQRLLEIIET